MHLENTYASVFYLEENTEKKKKQNKDRLLQMSVTFYGEDMSRFF